jgi:hypothetical protein
LFKDDNEMMDFIVQRKLRTAGAYLLERQGQYWEAIQQWLEGNQVPAAMDVHLRHIDDASRDPRIMNALTSFLWRHLSFGLRTWPKSAGVRVDKILELLGALSKQNLGTSEKNMASVSNMLLAKRLNLANRSTSSVLF